jgi:hypothetical protein
MIRFVFATLASLQVRVLLVSVLTVAVVLNPTWPAVVALLVAALYAGLNEAFRHFAERDQRLDEEARRNAKKAALVMDELVKRLQHLEEWQSAVKMNQHRGPSWQQMMNGGAP